MATVEIGWLARNSLARHRPLIQMAQIALFVIGALFWVDSLDGGKSFTPDVWGALAYSIPAECWAASFMLAAAITYIGLVKPVRNWMVITGAAMHCVQHLTLSYSATFTGGVPVIGLYASLFFLPLHLWLLIESATAHVRPSNAQDD